MSATVSSRLATAIVDIDNVADFCGVTGNDPQAGEATPNVTFTREGRPYASTLGRVVK
jgi:hypothetical protein